MLRQNASDRGRTNDEVIGYIGGLESTPEQEFRLQYTPLLMYMIYMIL